MNIAAANRGASNKSWQYILYALLAILVVSMLFVRQRTEEAIPQEIKTPVPTCPPVSPPVKCDPVPVSKGFVSATEEAEIVGGILNPTATVLHYRASTFDVTANKQPVVTDKVTTHKYQFAYGFLLQQLRGRKVKMLEIGLGCGMGYGPGASINLWKDYFGPHLELHILEYDATCAAPYRPKVDQLFTGDQSNREVLKKLIADGGGSYDFITDDGGHTMNQQIVSWQELWRALKPGGIYVIEDLQTSYWANYGGKVRGPNTTIERIKDAIDGFYTEAPADLWSSEDTYAREIHSMHCWHELCAFIKKWQ